MTILFFEYIAYHITFQFEDIVAREREPPEWVSAAVASYIVLSVSATLFIDSLMAKMKRFDCEHDM